MQFAADRRVEANKLAFERLTKSDPVLVDVRPAGEFIPGFTRQTILTSGPPMAWSDYTGGQREAIIGGALFENLAKDRDEAIAKLDAGEIKVGGCHDFGCVGSLGRHLHRFHAGVRGGEPGVRQCRLLQHLRRQQSAPPELRRV